MENKCNAYHNFTFPWLVEYRCGNCFYYLGENSGHVLTKKCPSCGYINDMKNSSSKIKIDDYPRIIKTVENEVSELEKQI